MVGAEPLLTHLIQDEEFIIASARHRFSTTDSDRRPTERKCTAIRYAVTQFRNDVAGSRFTIITEYSAFT